MLSAVAGCFNEYRVNKFSKYELAELVFQSERLHSNISTDGRINMPQCLEV